MALAGAVWSPSSASPAPFRFSDDGLGGRGHDLFGSAEFNAVPRMGKRVGGPYDSFRFRFNDGAGIYGRALAGGNAGFR